MSFDGTKLFNELCNRVDIEDLPWNGGDLDIKTFVTVYINGLERLREK